MRHWTKYGLIWAVLSLWITSAQADPPPSQRQGIWSFMMLQGQVHPKIRTSLEVHLRGETLPQPGQFQALQITPAFGLELIPDLYLWAAYSRFEGMPEQVRDENRLWQQLVFDRTADRVRALVRMRVEERFFVGMPEVVIRLRVLLRTAIALDAERVWNLVAQNEVFLHLNSAPSGPFAGFDQNRVQMTVQRQWFPWWTMDAGYQLQYQVNTGQPDRMSHNLVWINSFRLPDSSSNKDLGTQE